MSRQTVSDGVGPSLTIDSYGSAFRVLPDGTCQVSRPCNARRKPDRTPCAYGRGHRGRHSWEDPEHQRAIASMLASVP